MPQTRPLMGTEGCDVPPLCPGWGGREFLWSNKDTEGKTPVFEGDALTRLVLDVGLGPALGGDLGDVHLLVLNLHLRRKGQKDSSETQLLCNTLLHIQVFSLPWKPLPQPVQGHSHLPKCVPEPLVHPGPACSFRPHLQPDQANVPTRPHPGQASSRQLWTPIS